jgi:hypothetical protein
MPMLMADGIYFFNVHALSVVFALLKAGPARRLNRLAVAVCCCAIEYPVHPLEKGLPVGFKARGEIARAKSCLHTCSVCRVLLRPRP